MSGLQGLRKTLYYIVPSTVSGFAYGWEVGSMGGILAMPQFLNYMDTPGSFRQGLMTAALICGEFFGVLLAGMFLADCLGRLKTIQIGILVYIVGQVLVIAAQNQGMFIAGRVINGLGAAPWFQTISFYTAEVAPPHIRGRVTATLNCGIAAGILVAYWVQYGAVKINNTGAWRLCFALQLVPAIIVSVIMFFRPESPRFLATKGKDDQALAVLTKLHGDEFAKSELEEIVVVVELEKSGGIPSYPRLIFGKEYRRRTALGMGLQCMQQLSGCNIVLYYAAKVFAQTGQTGTSAALLANGIGSALLLVGSVSLTLLIDWYGRRKPMVIGFTTMGVCLIVIASLLFGYGSPHFDTTTQAVQFTFFNHSAGSAAVAFMFLFQFFFGAFNSCLPWTYQSEVFPVMARARGTALAVATNYFINFWLGLYIPRALNSISWKLYYIFGCINIACAIIGFLFFPETAGRSLEELDLLFTPDRNILVFSDRDARSKKSLLAHHLGEDGDPSSAGKELLARLGYEKNVRGDSIYKQAHEPVSVEKRTDTVHTESI